MGTLMTTVAITDVLRRSAVFGSLDNAELTALADGCGERSYGPGELVFLRGDPAPSMYIVASGSVAISLAAENGRDVLLAVLGAHEALGELAVVDGGPRVATVTARSLTVLVCVPRRLVADLIARRPAVATALLRSLAAMVRSLDERACDVTTLDLPQRVEKYLVALTVTQQDVKAAGNDGLVPVCLPLNQTDLARQVGGSRQQINRILMDLEAAGSIERLGHRIVGVRPGLLFSGQ
jgi:CRP/FNR family transcriptional regulator, cyclic AMP receptor protein